MEPISFCLSLIAIKAATASAATTVGVSAAGGATAGAIVGGVVGGAAVAQKATQAGQYAVKAHEANEKRKAYEKSQNK